MSFRPICDPNAFRSAVVLGQTTETNVLEFKECYRWQKAKHRPEDMADQAEELSRDVAQFANRDGGTLLVGVSERAADGGRRVADAICAVDDIDGFKQWVEQAIRTHLVPATFSRSLDTVVLSERTILAVNVTPSIELVALWHPGRKKGIEYLCRTDHGKQWMNPDEVERHIMNGSRCDADPTGPSVGGSRSVERQSPRRTYAAREGLGGVWLQPDGSSRQRRELGVQAWTTVDHRVGLCLKVAIVFRPDGSLGLEPLASAT